MYLGATKVSFFVGVGLAEFWSRAWAFMVMDSRPRCFPSFLRQRGYFYSHISHQSLESELLRSRSSVLIEVDLLCKCPGPTTQYYYFALVDR